MSAVIAWIAAEAEQGSGARDQGPGNSGPWSGVGDESSVVGRPSGSCPPLENGERWSSRPHQLPTHQFPAKRFPEWAEDGAQVTQTKREVEEPHDILPEFPPFENHPSTSSGQAFSQNRGDPFDSASLLSGSLRASVGHPASVEQTEELSDSCDNDLERRIYRRRTVAMLRRYLRYSIETGRLPSLLGREFFRAKVSKYTMHTFEDRVIFVHDMEMCLERLDEFSRQIIARHILQEHDQAATARLLHCGERTVRRFTPVVLDELSEILLEVGLMERIGATVENSCQEGQQGEIFVSDCEDGE